MSETLRRWRESYDRVVLSILEALGLLPHFERLASAIARWFDRHPRVDPRVAGVVVGVLIVAALFGADLALA